MTATTYIIYSILQLALSVLKTRYDKTMCFSQGVANLLIVEIHFYITSAIAFFIVFMRDVYHLSVSKKVDRWNTQESLSSLIKFAEFVTSTAARNHGYRDMYLFNISRRVVFVSDL